MRRAIPAFSALALLAACATGGGGSASLPGLDLPEVGAGTTLAFGPAAKRCVENAGMTFDDIDLFEVNEAFAAVVLKFLKDTGVPWDRVNVNGGAMALGHPIGATGAMLIGTLLDELERQDKTLGLVTMCTGGGMGTATIIERL